MALHGVPNVVAVVYDVYHEQLLICSAYVNQSISQFNQLR
jgi:hypothetical protein